jgi:hypothetical protein
MTKPEQRVPRRHHSRIATVGALALGVAAATAHAQEAKPDELSIATSITGINTFNTDLDRGGDFHWATGIASGSLTRRFTPQLTAGITLRYDFQDWKFGNPAAFGGQAPWKYLNAPNIAIDLRYAFQPDILIGVTPTIGWGYESGAGGGNALIYGGIVSATKVFSPSLVLGVGAGIVRLIDETKVFPFVIINWQIDEHWRVSNPFAAGPAGGAGVELAYAPDDRWEFAIGGAYRLYRFRLNDSGPAPGGVGENRFLPLFARVTRKLGPQTRIDLYAGASVAGRLSVDDANSNGFAQDDYKTAPAIGITLAHRY